MAGGNGLSCSINLELDGFAGDYREVKEKHSEFRRASALCVIGTKALSIGTIMNKKDINYFSVLLIIINIVCLLGKPLEERNQINYFHLMRTFQGEEKQYFLGRSIEYLGDINNDGYADFAIGIPGADSGRGRIDIYYGNSNPDSLKKNTLNGNKLWNNFGKINNIGDINRDGNIDILIGSLDSNNIYSYCHIYTGNDTGWFEYRKSIAGEESYDGFGAFSGSGDFNGDGYSDFIICAPNFDRQRGKVYIYLGSDTIPDQPYLTIQGDSSLAYFAGSVAGVGDVNNDGYDDFVVGGPLANLGGNYYSEGYFRLYFGGTKPDTIPDIEMYGDQEGMELGASICAGDFNGDSIDDFIVCSMGNGFVYWGKENISNEPDLIIGDSDNLIAYLYPAGDINGDGYDDILSGLPSLNWNNGAVDIYLGSKNFDGIYDHRIYGEWASYFGWTLSAAGDVNGDGLDDFLIGEPRYFLGIHDQGRVYLFSGDSTLVGIDTQENTNKPDSFKIIGNYPNPFNDSTTIRYLVALRGIYYLKIYNILGQLIYQKKVNHQAADQYNFTWNAKDTHGEGVSSGLYFVTLIHEGYNSQPIKMLFLK